MPNANARPLADLPPDDPAIVDHMAAVRAQLMTELRKVIVGQDTVIDQLLLALVARGHALLVGVPGLAKTLLISTLAKVLHLQFSRIQFTPDLMPSDITGTDILEEDRASGRRAFRFVPGPVFANVVLADEINRTPPKTQAALLQAMQEHQVTSGGQTRTLAPPFFVLATQNPIEQEGTYPLPEAQLDRFMFMIRMDYPPRDDERAIVKTTTAEQSAEPAAVLTGADILVIQQAVRRVPATDHVVNYAVALARATRPHQPDAPDFVNEYVTWGAGPRAAQFLVLGAKAKAVLAGRVHVTTDDVRGVASAVLRHRLVVNFNADADNVSPDDIVLRLLKQVAEPTS